MKSEPLQPYHMLFLTSDFIRLSKYQIKFITENIQPLRKTIQGAIRILEIYSQWLLLHSS